MSRYKDFAAGGNLLPTDLNAIQDDYEQAFALHKTVWLAPMDIVPEFVSYSDAGFGTTAFTQPRYLDPARYAAPPRVTKYQLQVVMGLTASANMSGTMRFALYPVVAPTGGYSWLGVESWLQDTPLLGSEVPGSGVSFTDMPSGTAEYEGLGSEFNAPTAGFYALGVATNQKLLNLQAESYVATALVELRMREV